ncbi:MAG TPA: NUDIX domain-containing protein [Anaerolineae bacterium]|nr:NUDIX domain-containing protein [Anaerolineae bacterium]
MPQQLFSIGAFAIIFDEQGRVLLCHRRDRDMWNLPGGGVERGELPTEAVVREVKEETGLEVIVERLVGVYGKPEKAELIFAFACRIAGGQLLLTDESDANRYFDIERLPANLSRKQVSRIHDAASEGSRPIFRWQTEPSIQS